MEAVTLRINIQVTIEVPGAQGLIISSVLQTMSSEISIPVVSSIAVQGFFSFKVTAEYLITKSLELRQ